MDSESNAYDEWDTPQEFKGVKLPKWPNNAFPEPAQNLFKSFQGLRKPL